MNKRKIILISILCTLLFLGVKLWSNGVFQTTLRAIINQKYPSKIKKIENNIIEFDLFGMKPAILAIGVRYPINYTPPGIEDWKIDEELEVKLYRTDKIIKSDLINRIGRTYLDFNNTGYKVSVFHTFTWSPNPIINPKARLEINLNDKFKNLDLILFDYGIK